MLNWRYHLVSLIAVFLALGLGILVGISITGNGVVDVSREELVDDIQQDMQGLRDDNNQLSQERATNVRYQEDTFPFLVVGRLQGKKVALVASSSTGDEIQRKLASAIHGAGGTVVSTTILNPRFDAAAAAAKVRAELKNDPQYATIDEATFTSVASRQMAKDIGRGGNSRLLPLLQGTMVDATSGRYDTPVDAVVIVTRADDSQVPAYTDLEKNLLLNLKELDVLSVGTEPSDAPRSEIPLFQSVDVSSVDNLDSRIGQVSLICILTGEKGAFGIKATADMLIPILRVPKPAAATATATAPQDTATSTAAAGTAAASP